MEPEEDKAMKVDFLTERAANETTNIVFQDRDNQTTNICDLQCRPLDLSVKKENSSNINQMSNAKDNLSAVRNTSDIALDLRVGRKRHAEKSKGKQIILETRDQVRSELTTAELSNEASAEQISSLKSFFSSEGSEGSLAITNRGKISAESNKYESTLDPSRKECDANCTKEKLEEKGPSQNSLEGKSVDQSSVVDEIMSGNSVTIKLSVKSPSAKNSWRDKRPTDTNETTVKVHSLEQTKVSNDKTVTSTEREAVVHTSSFGVQVSLCPGLKDAESQCDPVAPEVKVPDFTPMANQFCQTEPQVVDQGTQADPLVNLTSVRLQTDLKVFTNTASSPMKFDANSVKPKIMLSMATGILSESMEHSATELLINDPNHSTNSDFPAGKKCSFVHIGNNNDCISAENTKENNTASGKDSGYSAGSLPSNAAGVVITENNVKIADGSKSYRQKDKTPSEAEDNAKFYSGIKYTTVNGLVNDTNKREADESARSQQNEEDLITVSNVLPEGSMQMNCTKDIAYQKKECNVDMCGDSRANKGSLQSKEVIYNQRKEKVKVAVDEGTTENASERTCHALKIVNSKIAITSHNMQPIITKENMISDSRKCVYFFIWSAKNIGEFEIC